MGYPLAFPTRRATHEFIITLKDITDKTGVTALDVAKRLIDYGFHPPTMYFPTLVAECLLIEPTETEAVEMLDEFLAAMRSIYQEIMQEPDTVKTAPHNSSVARVDEVLAMKELKLVAEQA